jgi:hypothetical protein
MNESLEVQPRQFRGAHAPSRADFGALAEIFFESKELAIARARSVRAGLALAREARALPK